MTATEVDHAGCRCPCTCGHAHDKTLPATCTFCRAMASYRTAKGEGRTMGIYELAQSIRETNEKNGFDCPTWDNLPNKVMFAVTELDEGMDAIVGDGDDPLSEELADTAVRILDILYAIWGSEWADRTIGILNIHPEGVFQPGEVILWKPLRLLCKCVEAWRHDKRQDVRIALEMALREVFAIAALIGHDLHVDIEWKNAKNATRGKYHGKARSEG